MTTRWRQWRQRRHTQVAWPGTAANVAVGDQVARHGGGATADTATRGGMAQNS